MLSGGTYMHAHRQTPKQINGQTDRHRDTHTHTHTHIHTHTHTHTHTYPGTLSFEDLLALFLPGAADELGR